MRKSPDTLRPSQAHPYKGVIAALLILFSWGLVMSFGLTLKEENQGWLILLFPVSVHLYTGLFITAHDGMHGLIHPNRVVNRLVATIFLWLFAFNRYSILHPKHHLHHAYPAQKEDPDFATHGFWRWYFKFLMEYVSWSQVLLVAIVFNLGLFWGILESRLLLFYAVAPIVATLQLFYFGTYLPHRGLHPQEDVHRARSQAKNHLIAFCSCYFFGYHQEHHAAPWLAWWQLPQLRELNWQAEKQLK